LKIPDMDTKDRQDGNLPARVMANSLPSQAPGSVGFESGYRPGDPVAITPSVVARGLSRHWWRILLLWLLLALPAAYGIYTFVKPTYEASSTLRIEPAQPALFAPLSGSSGADNTATGHYIATQVNIIKSRRVLERAVADAAVVGLNMVLESKDIVEELAEKLVVAPLEDAYLIRVSLESPDAEEAAAIVRAVVQSYLIENREYSGSAKNNLKKNLETKLKELDEEIARKRAAVEALSKKGTVVVSKPRLNLKGTGSAADDPSAAAFSSIDAGHYSELVTQLQKVQVDLINVEAELEARKEAQRAYEADLQRKDDSASSAELELRIEEEFAALPEVASLREEIAEVNQKIKHGSAVSRRGNDPALIRAKQHLNELSSEYEELWKAQYDRIKARLAQGGMTGKETESLQELEQRQQKLAKVKRRLADDLDKLQIEEKSSNNDAVNFTFANHELTSLLTSRDQVQRNLSQVEFESNQEQYRISLLDPAAVPKAPSKNKQWKYMAAASGGLLFLMLGLFLMLEVKAERVADPAALQNRVRSEVYALPPLPSARAMKKLPSSEADDQVEQFIQRLDHLRFAVCGEAAEIGTGRCVIITSAIGGEGKTTLAAQLAARCGCAGMSTLLIDADLRRTSLARLLDIPDGLGLSDVLKNDVDPESVVIPVQGGAFHVLPAGTPVQDTSRVLQNRKFGILISQMRQVYDLVIIDSPPVLPVPDALILGRWADGAVLAARYDVSRFPQVERARRQLDNAGIPVLGTVINGMRNADTYYGRYTYSRRRGPTPDPSNTI